ncbi:MAG: hypothetical protein KJ799_07515 [Bacteroidetes bacterium]|nr:hypothetical protein [Bacteroidota bacterium]
MAKNKIQISSKYKITMFKTTRTIGDCKLKIVIYPDKMIGTSFEICILGFSGLGIDILEYIDPKGVEHQKTETH